MRNAVILLNADGTVARTHRVDVGSGSATPTTGPSDLESLIAADYRVVRETALDGGKVLLVLEKP